MGWLRRFIAICALVLAAGIAALVVFVSTVDLGMSWHGIAAMFLGATVTLGLGMVLMGLVFFSNRVESEERVRQDDERHSAPKE